MKYLPKRAAVVALVLLSLLALESVVRAQSSGQKVDEEAFRSITNRLMCQCGSCSYLVLSCNHISCSSSIYISKTVRNALAAGKSEEAILASLAEEYGPQVLAEPPREGFTWLGWIMPYIALLLGGGAVAIVLWRWKRTAAPDESEISDGGTAGLDLPDSARGPDLVNKYRAEIDRELGKD